MPAFASLAITSAGTISGASVTLVMTSALSHKKSTSAASGLRTKSGLWVPFFSRLSQGPSRWRPSAWCGCFSRYSRMTRMPCFINSSLVVISVGRKLVQPDFSLAFCIISSVSTLTASAVSLNCTPPQPFSCTSIKPGERMAPFNERCSIPGGSSAIGQTRSIRPLATTSAWSSRIS